MGHRIEAPYLLGAGALIKDNDSADDELQSVEGILAMYRFYSAMFRRAIP